MSKPHASPTVNKSLALYAAVVHRFANFCEARGDHQNHSISVAMLAYTKMSAAERENAKLELDAFLKSDEGKRAAAEVVVRRGRPRKN